MQGWNGKRVFVTGAPGFFGQRLVRQLADAGAHTFAGVAPDEASERVAALPAQVQRLVFDLRDIGAVRSAVAEAAPRIIFHLAAVGTTDSDVDPSVALMVNAGGTLHLLEAVREYTAGRENVQRVVLTGTCLEYGAREAAEGLDPFNIYAASKVAAWAFGRMYWRAYDLPVVTVRPFQVYGPGQPEHTLIPAAIRAALAGEDFPMTLGEQKRDFIALNDVVAGMLAAAQAPGVAGHSLDLGTGRVCSAREIVERIWAMSDARGDILAGALPYRPGEVMHLVADADRTTRLTGWRARVELEDGLRDMLSWYRQFPSQDLRLADKLAVSKHETKL